MLHKRGVNSSHINGITTTKDILNYRLNIHSNKPSLKQFYGVLCYYDVTSTWSSHTLSYTRANSGLPSSLLHQGLASTCCNQDKGLVVWRRDFISCGALAFFTRSAIISVFVCVTVYHKVSYLERHITY